jgi:hypothetical protein
MQGFGLGQVGQAIIILKIKMKNAKMMRLLRLSEE